MALGIATMLTTYYLMRCHNDDNNMSRMKVLLAGSVIYICSTVLISFTHPKQARIDKW